MTIMKENKILVPVDFTSVNDKSVEYAIMIAKKGDMSITLLHIDTEKTESSNEEKLKIISERIKSEDNIQCEYIIRKGNIFTEISNEACDLCYQIMVIGSHGIKGIREKFFGADILKLVKSISIPVFVIQKDYHVPQNGMNTIVFPASTHNAFANKINATVDIASKFNSTVHLYTVKKPGTEWPKELVTNLELAKKAFEDNKIEYNRVNEEQSAYSAGFSKQILQYANNENADLIAIVSVESKEYYNIADADKQAILTNDNNIPVLCTSDKSKI